MGFKEDLILKYKEKKLECESDKSFLNNIKSVKEEFVRFKNKFETNSFELKDYNRSNDGSEKDYLTYFLEHKTLVKNVFLGFFMGSSKNYMVYRKYDGNYFVKTIKDSEFSDSCEDLSYQEANEYLKKYVTPIFKSVLNVTNLKEAVELEKSLEYQRFPGKMLIKKFTLIHSEYSNNLKDNNFKFIFIYQRDALLYLFKELFGKEIDPPSYWFELNNKIYLKSLEAIKENVDSFSVLERKALSKALWDLWINYKNDVNKSNNIQQMIGKCFKFKKQIVLTGAPGTGKTFNAILYAKNNAKKNSKVENVVIQFHPSYDYSDFVEGIRPVILEGNEEATFVKLDGTFKAFCRDVIKYGKTNHNYYFIIDEINRADLSKVFGELLSCLEDTYRGKENRIQTQYYSLEDYELNEDGYARKIKDEDNVFKDGFYIPENVYIIGTMNDIDKNVESFDFALRRRFNWIKIDTDEVTYKDTLKSIGLNERFIDLYLNNILLMNEYISSEGKKYGLNESYHIGPAYFKSLNSETNEDEDIDYKNELEDIFETKIEPLLKEYLRGRDYIKFIEECKNLLLLGKKDEQK